MKVSCIQLLVLGAFTLTTASECETGLQKCGALVRPILGDGIKKSWLRKKKTLNRKCKVSEKYQECIDDYIEKCLLLFSEVANIVSENKEVLTDICTEGTDLRQKYLENADCMKRNLKSFKVCFPTHTEGLAEESSDVCKLPQLDSACLYERSQTKCGKNAELVARAIREPIDSVKEEMCKLLGKLESEEIEGYEIEEQKTFKVKSHSAVNDDSFYKAEKSNVAPKGNNFRDKNSANGFISLKSLVTFTLFAVTALYC